MDEDKNGDEEDEEDDEEEDAPAATITVAATAPSWEGPELDPPAATPALGGPDTPVPPYMEWYSVSYHIDHTIPS